MVITSKGNLRGGGPYKRPDTNNTIDAIKTNEQGQNTPPDKASPNEIIQCAAQTWTTPARDTPSLDDARAR